MAMDEGNGDERLSFDLGDVGMEEQRWMERSRAFEIGKKPGENDEAVAERIAVQLSNVLEECCRALDVDTCMTVAIAVSELSFRAVENGHSRCILYTLETLAKRIVKLHGRDGADERRH